ncbi:MAG: hypothetical protein MPJ22_02365, partial [Pirellulales bacterium]|nr:hypothetical protein [Pirellulales bacterium]
MLMHRACKLARRGEGFVEPNPMVGAVVANSDGTVLGEGWHKQFGGAHAEVHALTMAGQEARGATLFVTPEPCCHTGKKPPRPDAILSPPLTHISQPTRQAENLHDVFCLQKNLHRF